MDRAIQIGDGAAQLTDEDLLSIHGTLLSTSQDTTIVGRFRTDQNWIGGSDASPLRADDPASWCATFADATTIAAERASALGRSLADLREGWLEQAGHPRRNSSAWRLIEGLVSHPLVSVASAQQLLGVSDEAARLALHRLAAASVVRQVTVGRRNRAWAADDVFDLLDGFDMTMATAAEGGLGRPAPTRQLRPR